MKNKLTLRKVMALSTALALASTVAIAVVEFNYSGGFPVGVPWAVFIFLGVSAFLATNSFLMALLRFKGKTWLAVVLLIIAAIACSAWLTMFIDQLPCFLGGRGC